MTSQPAIAQVPDEDTVFDEDEIVVTARRRAESLLEVPIAVTVFQSDDIVDLGLVDIVDVSLLSPGFAMQNNSRQNEQPFIRGASVNSFFRDAQTSSFFHDGVFVGGVARTMGIDDIEQVEVIKGPQAVYFGRQTFAGAVNYIPKRPSFDGFEAHGMAEYGEDDTWRLSGGVSGPLFGDKLAARLYLQADGTDGRFDVENSPFRVQEEETFGFSGSVSWRPTANSEIRARAQIVEFDDSQNAGVLIPASENTCLPNAAGVNQAICGLIPEPSTIALNLDGLEFPGGRRSVEQERYSVHADFEFEMFNLSLISAYSQEDNINSADGDGLPVNIFRFTFTSEYEDTTQQIVLTSKDDQRLRWTVGGLYFWSNRVESSLTFPFNVPSTPRRIENIAVFGQVDYDITPELTLGLGGRYSSDDIERVGIGFQNTFESFLPRVSLDWQVNENTLLFGIVSKGNQPGDFNTNAGVPVGLQVVEEQELWNYELGYRQNFHDGRGLFAAGAYYIDWTNQAIQFPVATGNPLLPTVVATTNAGETRIYGVEAEANYQWTPRLSTRATFSYTDAEFEDFLSRRPGGGARLKICGLPWAAIARRPQLFFEKLSLLF
ncbi:MAG: TonB-dependent receptor, partial [Pseudomonadota bacterium]